MTSERASDEERTVDIVVARLPTVDLEPLTARAMYQSAERRLRDRRPRLSAVERSEPAILVAMASLHLLWALARVFSSP